MTSDSAAPRPRRPILSPARAVRRPFSLFLLLLFAWPIFHASERRAFAQDDDAPASPDEVVRVRTDLVTVPALVTDSDGRRVYGLAQSDFSVLDNGRAVTLSYFAAGTDKVALAFALDASGSVRELVSQQREAALQLFARFGRGSRVAVVHFGETAALTVPFTTDASLAEPAFSAHVPASRRTAIFDAAATVLRAFAAERSSPAERRILILISDGLDTASVTRASAVIDEARAQNVSIYVIHLPLFEPRDGRLAVRSPAKGFRDLALKTGGRYFVIGDAKSALDASAPAPDLTPVFRAIEEDLQGQYVLGYYPDEASRAAASHRIEINLTARNRRNLRVRALREEYNLKQ
jgi:Ca-activated chloride channel family protein